MAQKHWKGNVKLLLMCFLIKKFFGDGKKIIYMIDF